MRPDDKMSIFDGCATVIAVVIIFVGLFLLVWCLLDNNRRCDAWARHEPCVVYRVEIGGAGGRTYLSRGEPDYEGDSRGLSSNILEFTDRATGQRMKTSAPSIITRLPDLPGCGP